MPDFRFRFAFCIAGLHDDGTVRCTSGAGIPPQKFCDMEQLSQPKGKEQPFSRVVIARPAKGQPVRLIAQPPVNVAIAAGVKIELGGKELSSAFTRCLPAGCFATADIKDDALRQFRAASTPARLIYADAAGQAVAVPLSFKGFGLAFERAAEAIGAAMTVPTTRDELEAGRRLFAGEWRFVAAAGSPASLPPMKGTEIALAGRSNVGKSSLINALTGRKVLARISRTPGRTQELIFFTGGENLSLVDMPGYGYAAAAKAKIAAWTELIHGYLRGRANLARVYVLVDARHGLKDTDAPMLDALGQAAVSHQIVLTKCDAVKEAELARRMADVAAALAKRPAAFPAVLATSARDGTGIADLRAAIARLLRERRSG